MAGDNNGVKYEFRVSLRTTESTLKFTDACVSGHPPMQWLVRDPAGVQGHDKLMRRKVFMLIDLTEVKANPGKKLSTRFIPKRTGML